MTGRAVERRQNRYSRSGSSRDGMTGGDDPIAADAYDELADDYDEEVASNPYNAHFAFPATTSLIPDVEGERILDAGCGSGVYTEWLLERGAEVVGVDVSREMLDHAVENVGDRAELHRADLAEPLDFADDSFDGVVSALALGYVRDWRPTFSEFARVLKPGGFVVFTTTHPADEIPLDDDENYYEVERKVKEWAVDVPYYRRPFSEMINPLLETGFRIDSVLEPQPTDAFEEQWPERYETESRHPVFLCVRAVSR